VPATEAGAGNLLSWVDKQAPGLSRAWVIDGTRSHGLGLTRHLKAAGETVIEAPRIKRLPDDGAASPTPSTRCTSPGPS
jgi:hypothetical protein